MGISLTPLYYVASLKLHIIKAFFLFLSFRYNPYSKVLSREYYDQPLMKKIRKKAIDKARTAEKWGLILGTLGRQGNTRVMDNLQVYVLMMIVDFNLKLINPYLF